MKKLITMVAILAMLMLGMISTAAAMNLSGTYYIGAAGTAPGSTNPEFVTLKAACDSLNTGTVTGNVLLYITSDLTEPENVDLAVNTASYSITFKPYTGVTPTVTYTQTADNTGASGAWVIGIKNTSGAAYVPTYNIVIDGSNTVDGTTRDLTFVSASGTNAYCFRIKGDCDDVTIKNCVMSVTTASYGIWVNSQDNNIPDNLTIDNCSITATSTSAASPVHVSYSGTITATMENLVVSNNDLIARHRGVYLNGNTNVATIEYNTFEINQTAPGYLSSAIIGNKIAAAGVTNIFGNDFKVNETANTFAANGIRTITASGGGTFIIANNFFRGFAAPDAGANASEILGIRCGSAVEAYHNTFVLNDIVAAGSSLYRAISIAAGSPIIKNNVFVTEEDDFASYCIAGTPVESDYNNFDLAGMTNAKVGLYTGVAQASLSDWQTASSLDVNSVTKAVEFASATDLHLAGTSLGDFDLAGTPIAAVTADFDGDSRDATYPYMGADEGSVVLTPPAAAPDVFFSEYIEGSSNNKAVEIYNGSGESVDLANFAVWRISNDGDWAEGETNAFALSGTLADGDVYVIGNAGAVAAILDVSDVTGTTTYFNGDDPIALVYNGIIIDVVGAPYVVDSADDPIVGWDVAGVTDATAEHTMVRKTSVTTGNTDWAASAGTNADDSEWEVYPQNTFEFLGEHPSMPRVFFSEYIEGSSNNKAVEIYNGSGESVDLANFAVWRISNDGDWTEGETNAFALSGTLTNGDVYVIGNASAVAAILDVSDVTGTTTYFNGDDPIALVYNGIIIDVVGAPYVVDSADDPIAGWDVAGVTDATAEHTMVRKASVTKGNTDWAASAGTNVDDSEWIVYPVDTFDYLGEHPTIVNPDSDPPLISKIKAMNQTTVVVTFNEDVDPATAGTVANYSIDNSIGAATAAVVVDSVVTLTVATLTYDLQYVLTVNTVEDIAGNVIVANSTINFTLVTPTAPVGLFFSEYIEGGGDNKALEIYNGTDADVDLSNIQIFTNYNGNPYNDAHTFPEGAVLAAGDVWVIANSAAVQPILDAADELFLYNESGYIVGYNGDDVRALVHIHGADTTVLDIIGLYNFLDPGDGWDVAGVVSGTKDHTLVRKASVTSGNTDWATSAGTNADNSEWEAYGKDIVGYLGEHPTVIGAITTIAEIQDTTGTTNGDSKFKDQVVTTTGIVTAAKTGAYFIQDKTGPWNGVYVYDSGRTPTVGDSIVIKCKVAEYYNLTELANVEQYITMKVGLELPDPALLTTASYQEEQWEGVLVVVDSATCTNDATEWKIDDGSGEGIVDDVFIAYEATQGNMYTITGPVYYSFNLFRIVPANADFIIDLTPVPLTPFDWEIAAGDLSFFANDHLTRGMSFNPITNHVLVPSRTGGTNVFILDAATGDSLGKLDMTGVTGGTYTMNIVDVAEDGAIYLGNLALAAGNFKLYQWANETAVPTNIFDGVVSERTGDVIEVAGAGVNTVIYASGSASTSIFTWTTTDGAAFTLTDTISVAAGLARGGIAAIGDGGFWVNGSGTNTTHIDASGAVLNAADAGIIATGWQNVDYLHHSGGRKLIAVVGKNAADFGDQVQIYDITESEVSPVLFDSARFTSIYNANTNAAGDVHMIDNMDGTVTAYVMITNNGIGRYTFDVPDEVKELTIAGARIDADGDFYPDLNGKVVKVKGIITSPDYNLKYVPPVRDYPSISYYIQDETGGINLYTDKFKKYLKLGDEIEVTGEIASYLGVVEIIVADSNDLVLLSSDNALPEPLKLKIADIGESTEGLLVELDSVWFVDPSTWPAPGAYTNMDLTDGIDTIMFRVDDDTQLDEWGNPPQEMFRVICIASQYSYSTPPNDTYQLLGIDSTFFYPIIKEIVPVTVLDESFEDVFPPEDWRVFSKNVTAGTPTEPWNKSNNAPQSGTYNAHMGNYNTQSDCWLVTPPIDLLGEEMLDLLKFYARDDLNTSANDFGSELKIYASTLSNNDIADFVLVSTITEADCYGATPEFTINLKQFVDADYVFIGFMVHNFGDPLNPNAGGDNWNIDNVQLVADLGIKETIPVAFALNQNYPNPFNPTTNIKLALPEQADVKLTVYNIIGQEVAIIQAGKMQAGYHNFVFDASRLSSGVYFYRVEANNFHALKKMTILK